jgi:integrase
VKQITELALKNAKPQEKDYSLREQNGFVVRIRPSGSKTFYYLYRVSGEQKRLTIGTYPAMSLAEAREKHLEAMLKVKRGEDPKPQPTIENPLVVDPDTPETMTCQRLIDRYLVEWSKKMHSPAWHNTIKKALEKDFLGDYGQRLAVDIKRRDAIYIAEKLAHKPGTARNVLKALSGAWSWAINEEKCLDSSPFSIIGLFKRVPAIAPASRGRNLSETEIKNLWDAIDKGGGSDSTKRVLKLILLTAQRPGEVAGMTWKEIEIGEGKPICQSCRRCGWWTIPGVRREKAKKKSEGAARDHRVYLSRLAMSLINESKNEKYICPTDGEEIAAIRVNSINHHVRRDVPGTGKIPYFGLPRWTPHDLRRTAATHLGRLDALPAEIEQILGHSLGKVAGTYNLHTYDRLKRRWLSTWGECVQALLRRPD